MPHSKLIIEDISKTFRRDDGTQMPVLLNQSMEVADREFVALLGPSGCGKSTLLRIINGLVATDTGRVLLNGKDITGRPGEGCGMVFQSSDLLPWRTALGNVEFGLEVQGVGKADRQRVSRDLLRRVGLTEFEHAYPHQLSGGMQQRVGIARAFAINPEVLLMDEPFGALDVQTRDDMQVELLRLWEDNQKTVLFVTHGIEEALYLADRVMVFSPRPARVLKVFDIPFPRPRREEIKTEPLFLEMRREIGGLLRASREPALA